MSALVHKGKKVAETVDTPVQGILTQAEFDALTSEQQNTGLYIISDGQVLEGSGSVSKSMKLVINGETVGLATMEQVNAAITAAVTGAIEEAY